MSTTDVQRKLAAYGGRPARDKPLPPPYPGALFIGEEEKRAVVEVIESQSLFRYYGPRLLGKVDALEREFAKAIGVSRALAVSSGTAALRVALMSMGVGPGDEVVVPCYTFIATLGAVVSCHAVPVLCEIDASLGLDPEDLRRRISPQTKVILPVHFSGAPCRMDEIMAVAREHRLLVLEDVAQACGASYRGRGLGAIGDLGAFSLQLNKTITAGEGGLITASDAARLEAAARFHDQGFLRGEWDAGQIFGENYRMGELTAAVALAQLHKLETIVGRMRENKRRIQGGLQDLQRLRFREVPDPAGDAGNSVVFFLPKAETAREFSRLLIAENIRAGAPYDGRVVYDAWPQLRERRVISPSHDAWRYSPRATEIRYEPGTCPRSEDLVARAVFVPVSPALGREDCEQIVDGIRKVYRHLDASSM